MPSATVPELRFTVKAWLKFSEKHQEVLCRKYQIILTDHNTKAEKTKGILKAILRPTPTQRKNQKQRLENGIKKVRGGIDAFDKSMDDLSKSLKDTMGEPNQDPVKMVFGDRNNNQKTKVF
jgi:hypothetical protein